MSTKRTREGPAGSDKVTLKIPRPLYDRIVRLIEGSGYNSVTDFAVYVLRDIASTHAVRHPAREVGESDEDYTPDELELVKERLRSLGYL